ncbi:hypothetical protein PV325_002915 [Microctonus aethiopoides]|uniref:Cilia- and flagella-associated protein 206 n=1 Tax=Microctonus aethiopoides TaxID=144406 RepID=A0AA39C797_9HYME|nr:hypothetical protein PV325_002915 [Microctonus aethiopoides]KAK0158869.1 hypothetical protein PV328_009812 [Microctonus aethiopoides]
MATMLNTWKKNLIQTIVEECNEKNVAVSKDLVSFVVNLLQSNPDWYIDINNEEEINKTIDTITEKLLDQSTPNLITLKLQLHFAKHYSNRNETIKKYRQRLLKKSCPLIIEICETTRVNTDREMEKLYQKILVVITLMSGLGNPMIPSILKEAAMALQSVYLPSEVTHLVTLSRKEKEKQLIELMSIVAGIRLFNKDCKRGGDGIEHLPTILQEAIDKSRELILQLLEELMKAIYRLTTAVENIISQSTFIESDAVSSSQKNINSEMNKNIIWIIETLTTCRQQEIYIRKILADVEFCEREFKTLMERFQARLLTLHETVKYRTAIPIVQVYPQFINLSDIWMHLQEELVVVNQMNDFIWQLQTLNAKNIEIHDESKLEPFLKNCEILSDAERLERSMGQRISECGNCSIFYPNTAKDFESIHLQFLGFCVWTFVAGRGALIPGNPNIGVAKWRGKYYAFSANDAAKKFGNDPNKYVYQALDFIRRHPEYIHLFHVHEDIEAMNKQEESLEEGCKQRVHQDQSVQTDLHVFHTNIDANYNHSLWEHRKAALKLVNITQSRTRSTQTNVSHFKRTANIQASFAKSTYVQTRRDNECNTMRDANFIFGLRERKNGVQHMIKFPAN